MLYSRTEIGQQTELYIWKIDETLEQLEQEVVLKPQNQLRFQGMKSASHRAGFLSVRKLFETAGYCDEDVIYDITGKPKLSDGKHITITHSHEFSSMIISSQNVGIDMEKMRDKIIRIADKFTSPEEENYLDKNSEDYIEKLTVLWGIKEAIFKIRNEEGISFKEHISSPDFDLNIGQAKGILNFNNSRIYFEVRFLKIEEYILVYAFENTVENAL